MTPSPTKQQRVALAPLDANAQTSVSSPKMLKDGSTPLSGTAASPLKRVAPSSVSGAKRPAADDDDASPRSSKTCCVEETRLLARSRTSSPDEPSSMFDSSLAEGDSSWATAATEPELVDAPVLPAPRHRGSMTREQAREKAQILRLRLGLASYKLRTGQTTIPLADLQQRPLPPLSAQQSSSSSSSSSAGNEAPPRTTSGHVDTVGETHGTLSREP